MNADCILNKLIEYSSAVNNCCAFITDCVYTDECNCSADPSECKERKVFKEVKKALDYWAERKEE